jgi:phage N-6-adenine-methyltransferase
MTAPAKAFEGHPLTRLMLLTSQMGEKMKRFKESPAPHSEWSTELKWFRAFSEKYGPFDLDAAAAKWNAKCDLFFSKRQNALKQQWYGRVWLNAPYNPSGTIEKFIGYARTQALFNGVVKLVGCLLPHYTGDGWWRRHIASSEGLGKLLGVSYYEDHCGACYVRRYERLEIAVHEIPTRVRHMSKEGQRDSARYSSAFVVFKRPA